MPEAHALRLRLADGLREVGGPRTRTDPWSPATGYFCPWPGSLPFIRSATPREPHLMFRSVDRAVFHGLLFTPLLFTPLIVAQLLTSEIPAAVPESPAGDRCEHRHAAVQELVRTVNTVITTDVGLPPADFTSCPLERLPASRANLLPLLPPAHRRLIAECARGRTRVRRAVPGFDLMALLDEPVEATAEVTAIHRFFDERTVDVALGSAVSDGPYPISFDWAVVLDREARTLFSFIVNCRD